MAVLLIPMVSTIGLEHPLTEGFRLLLTDSSAAGATRPNLQDFLEIVDGVVDPEAEIAYWWPGFRVEGLSSLGLSFITARYRLPGRVVFPLLSKEDLEELSGLTEMDPRVLDFLRERSASVEMGRGNLVVASWGDSTLCRVEEWPNLILWEQIGGGCVLDLGPGSERQ